MAAGLKAQSIKSVVWATGDSVGVAVLSFASFIVLARALQPRDFGIVALASGFVFFFNLLTGHSFSDVIVQRLRLDAEHLDTAFWSTLGIALTLMGVCMAGADLIAALLGEPELASVLRWLSLILPMSAVSAVQLALFRRDMRFDTVAKRSIIGRFAGAVVGVAMALTGWGLWSLVAQQLVGVMVVTIAFSISPWRPRLRFSFAHLNEMWAFGMKVSVAQMIGGAGDQTLNLMIGTLFGSTVLGYFTVAWRMVQLVKALISSAVYHVGLSAFAKLQEDRIAVTAAFVKATRIACLIGFPIAIGMSLVGRPLIDGLFGDKWDLSIPLLMVLAFEMIPAFYCIFLSSLYRAMNRPSWVLWMAAIHLCVGVLAVLAGSPWGVIAVAVLWVARTALLIPFHMVLLHRLLGMSVAELVKPVVAPLGGCLLMGVCVAALRVALDEQNVTDLLEILVIVPVGAAAYGAAIWLLSPELFAMAMRTASIIFEPLRRKPTLVSKAAE